MPRRKSSTRLSIGTTKAEASVGCASRQPDGEYAAIDEANNDLGWPVGYGKTKRAAIEDLIEQMDERGLIEDHPAARYTRTRRRRGFFWA